jgi:hypothetical protein
MDSVDDQLNPYIYIRVKCKEYLQFLSKVNEYQACIDLLRCDDIWKQRIHIQIFTLVELCKVLIYIHISIFKIQVAFGVLLTPSFSLDQFKFITRVHIHMNVKNQMKHSPWCDFDHINVNVHFWSTILYEVSLMKIYFF